MTHDPELIRHILDHMETIFAADPDSADVAERLETPPGSGKQHS